MFGHWRLWVARSNPASVWNGSLSKNSLLNFILITIPWNASCRYHCRTKRSIVQEGFLTLGPPRMCDPWQKMETMKIMANKVPANTCQHCLPDCDQVLQRDYVICSICRISKCRNQNCRCQNIESLN
jgi:hypothetical protein